MRARKTATAHRREQIAEAALEVIARDGLQGWSIAEAADRVGIVPSAVYRHFKGKDDVIDAVLELLRKRLLENVEDVCRDSTDALVRLKALLARHIDMVMHNRAMPQVVFAGGLQGDRPERRAKVHDAMSAYLAAIRKIIRRGKRDGILRKDLNAAAAAVGFLGLVVPAVMLWSASGGRFDVDDQVRKAWPIYEKGISADPTTAPA